MALSFISSGRNIFCALLAVLALPLCIRQTAVGAYEAGEPGAEDKTLSPYFFVKSGDPAIDQLPLKSTSATVNISGVIADVAVVQVYKNEGSKPIEAIYVFPASTRAAVYGMKMTIGERTITAQIQKREEARQAYEKAKQEGKTASLLEQNRPNVFQMNVANILPGDEIRTELRYTELLVPADGVYELVYPAVVAPRYSNQPASTAPASEKWSQNPYLHSGEAPPYTFGVKANIAAGVPIQEITCTSHKTNISYTDENLAAVELDASEHFGGNRDFILKYRLMGDQIESGLLLYQGGEENFFLLMAQPPKRVTPASMPPREYVFIVDVSGSMHGFPLEISKKLVKDLISGLRPVDTFNVLQFSGGSELLSERSLTATPENVQRALALIDGMQGGGGTELLPALKRVLTLPRTEGVSRTCVIATDGLVTVEPDVFDLIRQHLGDANFFTFGIGTSVNRYLLEGMARVGAGEPFVATRPEEAAATAEKFRRYVQSPVLTRIKLDFGTFEAFEVEPPTVPDLFAERPVVVFGKWKGAPQGTITLSGLSGGKPYEKKLDVARVAPLPENSALRYLWARSWVTRLSDYNGRRASQERTGQITALGLRYNLLTEYTSFVAIDSEVRRKEGDLSTVTQPLPMPEGVSDYAVGGGSIGHYSMKAKAGPHAMAPPSPAAGRWQMDSAPRSGAMEPEKRLDAATLGGRAPAQEESGSRLVLEKLTVEGGLTEAAVRAVIEQNLAQLAQCVALESKVPAGSALTLKWTVDASGAVSNLRIESAWDGWKALLKCLGNQMAAWKLPAPKDGRKAHVTAVLRLQS
jgi:Ca-activated chloride channel homolog